MILLIASLTTQHHWGVRYVHPVLPGVRWTEVRSETGFACASSGPIQDLRAERQTNHAGWVEPTRFLKIELRGLCGLENIYAWTRVEHFAITSWEVWSATPPREADTCFCDAEGLLTGCTGICGPNGSCQTEVHACLHNDSGLPYYSTATAWNDYTRQEYLTDTRPRFSPCAVRHDVHSKGRKGL